MEKFFKYKWAVDGETTAVPNAIDPSGFVSYRQGYGADYSRVYGTDPLAKAPERVKLNAVLQDITSEIQSLQVHGFPDYITSTLNDGSPYAYELNAIVRFTDGLNYRNTVAGNTNAPNVSGWVLYNDPASAINTATAKTTPVDSDLIGIADSAASFALKKVTWANIKTVLTTLFAPKANPVITGSLTLDTSATLIFEGSSADAYETTLTVENPTADRTITLPNASGTVAIGQANDPAVMTALNAAGSAPVYACRAWVNFNGTGTVAIRGSGNVSSITDNGVGDYTVNFTTAMSDASYSIGGDLRGDVGYISPMIIVARNVSSLRVQSKDNLGSLVDSPENSINIFR